MHTLLDYSLLVMFLCAVAQNTKAASRIDPLVHTSIGLIRGLKSSDGTFDMFMGIPYATVDENNPFGPSTAHTGLNETFQAYDDSAMCPQIDEFNNTFVGSLDCLRLNVYVPNNASSSNRLPVMFFIHGGAFTFGSFSRRLYGPDFLVPHGVILVTINYRLGPYGFMCLDIPEVPGNQGVKDQRLALRWVKKHIEAFGGDSNKVTLMGQSAGASTSDLLLNFDTENLFQQVALHSGNAIAEWAVVKSDPTIPMKIAEHLGFSTDDLKEALTFISKADLKSVVASTDELNLFYRPCVEKVFDGVESFMIEHPLQRSVPQVKNIPLIIGNTDDEKIIEMATMPDTIIEDTIQQFFHFDEKNFTDVVTNFRHFYIGDEEINRETRLKLRFFNADYVIHQGAIRDIEKYLNNDAKVIYQYQFAYVGKRNFYKNHLNITIGGATHNDDLSYLFHMTLNPIVTAEDKIVIDRMTTLWTNFVKYGNPTPETSELLPTTWIPVSKDISYYLKIDSGLNVERRQLHARMAFWNFFYKLYKQFANGYDNVY